MTLLVLRFLTGLPCGSLMVICLKSVCRLNNVERGYALHTLGQILSYSVMVALLPHLFLSVRALHRLPCCSPWRSLLPYLGSRLLSASQCGRGKCRGIVITRVNWLGWLCLLSILLFYISLSGLWTYLERIGDASGISATTIGYVLSVTALLGMVGSGVAAWIAGRVSSLLMIIIGSALMVLSVWMFLGPQTLINYIAAASVAKLTWTFVLPFILGTLALIDYSGRLVTNLFMLIAFGLAIGPAIAALLIGSEANYDRSVLFSLWEMIAAMILITFVAYKARRVDRHAGVADMQLEKCAV